MYSTPANMSTERAPGREHVPRYTPGFITIRVLQLLLGLILLGLTAYTIAYVAFAGNCLMLFTSIVTIGASLYMIVTLSCVPKTYNYWAVLALDLFLTIFWLVSFAVLAWQAAWYFAAGAWFYSSDSSDTYDDLYDGYDSYYDDIYSDSYDYDFDIKRSVGDSAGLEKRYLSDFALTYGAILAAAAGLGGLQFLFYIISLIIHSCVTFRHRRAGLHSKPLAGTNANTAAAPAQNPQFHGQPQAYAAQPMAQSPQGYPPQQGYYVPQQQQPHQSLYAAPPQSQPQPSPVSPGADLSKSSSPQPQGGYVPYQPPPHPQQAEAPAGYPPQHPQHGA